MRKVGILVNTAFLLLILGRMLTCCIWRIFCEHVSFFVCRKLQVFDTLYCEFNNLSSNKFYVAYTRGDTLRETAYTRSVFSCDTVKTAAVTINTGYFSVCIHRNIHSTEFL